MESNTQEEPKKKRIKKPAPSVEELRERLSKLASIPPEEEKDSEGCDKEVD